MVSKCYRLNLNDEHKRRKMLFSMTAFARAEKNAGDLQMTWEIKSVNHRFLETYFRVPDALRIIETKIREVTRQSIKRGKVDGFLKIEYQSGTSDIKVNDEVLDQLILSIKKIQAKFKTRNVTPIEVLRWPGLLEEKAEPGQEIEDMAINLYKEALDKLIAYRQNEGEHLDKIIRSKLNEISLIVNSIKSDNKNIQIAAKEKLFRRISELETSVDPERLEQEITMLIQKSDITEELDRLSIHVAEGIKIIEEEGGHGRRLDFLSQELNRESNTLGAKASTPQLSQQAIDLKVAVEQIREQVQNIE